MSGDETGYCFDTVFAVPPTATSVVVAPGAVRDLGALMSTRIAGRHAVIISDEAVFGLHGPVLQTNLDTHGFKTDVIVIPPGEEAKTAVVLEMLWQRLSDLGTQRSSVIISFGGGSTSDVAGLAAGTYMRGLDSVTVPTTFLAQVDAALGAKTAINFSNYKNLIGVYKAPLFVLADTELLSTLPKAAFMSGVAEVAKAALLKGGSFLEWLCAQAQELVARRSPEALREAVRRAVEFKLAVVETDPLDEGHRFILNYGHSLGHALEAVLPSGSLSHGQAVVEGMRFAAQCAPEGLAALQDHLFSRLGLEPSLMMTADASRKTDTEPSRKTDAEPSHEADAEHKPDSEPAGGHDPAQATPQIRIDDAFIKALVAAMLHDKKNRGSEQSLVVLDAPGSPRLLTLTVPELTRALSRFLQMSADTKALQE
ncbi:MAG: 3-dehydroquinate synthase [Coriobacteriales bacterium]|jgi:3-dehydroquinate synthase|nr:3-dehydroquinate synthase [Coriobacteriales bacterium]